MNDGDETEMFPAVIAEHGEEHLPTWEAKVAADAVRGFGKHLENYGFIDVELPDAVIAQVLRRHADAGVVAAEAVES